MLIFLQKNKIDIMQRVIVTLCIISIPFFQSFSKRYSKINLKIDIPSENIHFRMQVYKGKNYFILPKVALNSLNKYMDNERIWQWQKTYIIGKTNVILKTHMKQNMGLKSIRNLLHGQQVMDGIWIHLLTNLKSM